MPTREMLIQELNIASLPPDLQDELIAGVSHNVMTHLLTKILAALPDNVQEEFKQLIESGQGTAAEALANIHIAHLDELIAKESRVALDEFKRLQAGTA